MDISKIPESTSLNTANFLAQGYSTSDITDTLAKKPIPPDYQDFIQMPKEGSRQLMIDPSKLKNIEKASVFSKSTSKKIIDLVKTPVSYFIGFRGKTIADYVSKDLRVFLDKYTKTAAKTGTAKITENLENIKSAGEKLELLCSLQELSNLSITDELGNIKTQKEDIEKTLEDKKLFFTLNEDNTRKIPITCYEDVKLLYLLYSDTDKLQKFSLTLTEDEKTTIRLLRVIKEKGCSLKDLNGITLNLFEVYKNIGLKGFEVTMPGSRPEVIKGKNEFQAFAYLDNADLMEVDISTLKEQEQYTLKSLSVLKKDGISFFDEYQNSVSHYGVFKSLKKGETNIYTKNYDSTNSRIVSKEDLYSLLKQTILPSDDWLLSQLKDKYFLDPKTPEKIMDIISKRLAGSDNNFSSDDLLDVWNRLFRMYLKGEEGADKFEKGIVKSFEYLLKNGSDIKSKEKADEILTKIENLYKNGEGFSKIAEILSIDEKKNLLAVLKAPADPQNILQAIELVYSIKSVDPELKKIYEEGCQIILDSRDSFKENALLYEQIFSKYTPELLLKYGKIFLLELRNPAKELNELPQVYDDVIGNLYKIKDEEIQEAGQLKIFNATGIFENEPYSVIELPEIADKQGFKQILTNANDGFEKPNTIFSSSKKQNKINLAYKGEVSLALEKNTPDIMLLYSLVHLASSLEKQSLGNYLIPENIMIGKDDAVFILPITMGESSNIIENLKNILQKCIKEEEISSWYSGILKKINSSQYKDLTELKGDIDKFLEKGEIVRSMARGIYESAKSVKSYKDARDILRKGFDSMAGEQKSEPYQKFLSELGAYIGQDDNDYQINDEDSCNARNVVIHAIMNPSTEPVVNIMAKTVYNAAQKSKESNSARTILRRGFEKILSNPEATQGQKAIAQLGIDVGTSGGYYKLADEESAKARYVVMEALKTPIKEGSVVSFISRLVCDAYDKVETYHTKRKAMMEGFAAIIKNSEATKGQKALAELGTGFGSSDLVYKPSEEDAAKARRVVMEALKTTIKEGKEGSVVSLIANLACEAYEKVGTYHVSRMVMREGFNAIINNREANDEQKKTAQLGLDSGQNMSDEDGAKARYPIMKSLAGKE